MKFSRQNIYKRLNASLGNVRGQEHEPITFGGGNRELPIGQSNFGPNFVIHGHVANCNGNTAKSNGKGVHFRPI